MTATIDLALGISHLEYSREWGTNEMKCAREILDGMLTTGKASDGLAIVVSPASGGQYFSYSRQWSGHEANIANALLRDIEMFAEIANDEGSDEPFSVTTEIESSVSGIPV